MGQHGTPGAHRTHVQQDHTRGNVAVRGQIPTAPAAARTRRGSPGRPTEGNAHNTIARVPHGLWERLADPTSFNVRRDEDAGGAAIAGGGDRLFVAGIGDSLEVYEYRVGDDAREPPRSPVSPAGMPRQGVHQVFASREGSLWVGQHDPAAESSVFNVFEESADGWSRTGTLTLQGNVRILDASRDRVLFVHRDSLGQETVVVGRGGG